ncbi:homeobox protein NOBOX [Tachyglossus aculeatus]|uniref:homeobox protein NOBOX n=1 Tax=Tachyglossus aculeatus TaxID=9261 RepID=UPI0018F40238|nr:homeobox protein NOBOX [Tachyglossus aculeatus]
MVFILRLRRNLLSGGERRPPLHPYGSPRGSSAPRAGTDGRLVTFFPSWRCCRGGAPWKNLEEVSTVGKQELMDQLVPLGNQEPWGKSQDFGIKLLAGGTPLPGPPGPPRQSRAMEPAHQDPNDPRGDRQEAGVASSPGPVSRRSGRSGAGRAPCCLSTLLGGNQEAALGKGPPKPPLEAPTARKKTRTLYRADQLEELERVFQEDHYPDSDKRREIALSVGVTPQRIMIWFQNRRAKWRKLEKLNGKGKMADGPAPGPGLRHCGPAPDHLPSLPIEPLLNGFPPHPLLPDSTSLLACDPHTLGLPPRSGGTRRVEVMPSLPSPPPIRRASLPFPLGPSRSPHLVPLLLDTPTSGCSPEGPWGNSFAASASCSHMDQLGPVPCLEPQGYRPGRQPGPFPLCHYPLNQLHSFPLPPSAHLTPPPPEAAAATAYFAFAYGAAGAPRGGYFPGPQGGQTLLPLQSENPGAVAALQPIPWSDPCLLGPPFSSQLGPGPQARGDCYLLEPAPLAGAVAVTASSQLAPGLAPFPGGPLLGDSEKQPGFSPPRLQGQPPPTAVESCAPCPSGAAFPEETED